MTTTDEPTTGTQLDDVEHIPGEPDIWFFVVFESLVFTSYFCVYLFFRTQHERAFLHAQSALDLPLGIIATIFLLTSSWSMARCVQLARAGRHDMARRFAIATAGLGGAFFVLKIVEWVRLVDAGHTFTSSDFMQYFFFLTSIHAIHLLIGFVTLGVLIRQLSDSKRRSQATVETCSIYWHTVDLYWVVIFALLYIVR
jgi:nitric oxide reductase NorE protein